tara:strand:- start:10424 stop:10555 length:132 start_codon:yes stop_codon:yes gene_type:complete
MTEVNHNAVNVLAALTQDIPALISEGVILLLWNTVEHAHKALK